MGRWLVAAALLAGGCGGGGGCTAVMASGDGLAVSVMPEGGCEGPTWRADVTFDDGHTQSLAGDRAGPVQAVMVGNFGGDDRADVAIAVGPDRVFAFVRQGAVLFGRELPAPPAPGAVTIENGRLAVAGAIWDPDAEAWRPASP